MAGTFQPRISRRILFALNSKGGLGPGVKGLWEALAAVEPDKWYGQLRLHKKVQVRSFLAGLDKQNHGQQGLNGNLTDWPESAIEVRESRCDT